MNKLCIIIPCYNEANRLNKDLFIYYLSNNADVDFCFVNDGSTDDTSLVINQFSKTLPERIIFLDYDQNRGKAEAIRQGMLFIHEKYNYDIVGYFDADLATPLEEIKYLKNEFRVRDKIMIVFGVRLKRLGANIHRKSYRHYMGRIFATVVSVIFDMPVYDSQCGAKLIKSELIPLLFSENFISGWLFDVEILLRMKKNFSEYDKLVYECPLNTWEEKGESKIKVSHLFKMPYQLMRIYKRYK